MNRLVEQFLFNWDGSPLAPRFNIAPSQPVAAVRVTAEQPERRLAMFRWGLIPSWAKDPAIGNRLINARGESVAEKPSFRNAFRRRRCLVLADGYYEWEKRGTKGKKQPYYFTVQDGEPFALAGLWERWHDADDHLLETCTIITTAANETARAIHDRMPVILNAADYDLWLDHDVSDAERLKPLLRPFPAELMAAYPVDTTVNNPRNETPECVARLPRDADGQELF